MAQQLASVQEQLASSTQAAEAHLQQQLSQLKEQAQSAIAAKTQELATLQEQLTASTQAAEAAAGSTGEQQVLNQQLQGQVTQLGEQVQQQQAMLEGAKQRIGERETSLQAAGAKVLELQSELKAATEQVQAGTARATALEAEVTCVSTIGVSMIGF